MWVDDGNSWVKRGQGPDAAKVTEEYSKIAKLVSVTSERALYLSAGDKHTPAWGRMSAEGARDLRQDLRRAIRDCTPRPLMVGDSWVAVKRHEE